MKANKNHIEYKIEQKRQLMIEKLPKYKFNKKIYIAKHNENYKILMYNIKLNLNI